MFIGKSDNEDSLDSDSSVPSVEHFNISVSIVEYLCSLNLRARVHYVKKKVYSYDLDDSFLSTIDGL